MVKKDKEDYGIIKYSVRKIRKERSKQMFKKSEKRAKKLSDAQLAALLADLNRRLIDQRDLIGIICNRLEINIELVTVPEKTGWRVDELAKPKKKPRKKKKKK